MKSLLGSWVNLTLAAAIVAIVFFGAMIFRNTKELVEIGDMIARTYQFLHGVESLVSLAKDAETSQRGFIITGNEEFLEPFRDVDREIEITFSELRSIFLPSPERDAAINNLESLIQRKIEFVKQTIAVRRKDGYDAARERVSSTEGKRRMGAVRDAALAIEKHQRQLLEIRKEVAERDAVQTRYAIVSGHALLFFLLIGGIVALRSERKRRDDAEEKTRASQSQVREQAALLDKVRDAIFACDMAGNIVYWNRGAETLYQWSAHEAVGQSAGRLLFVEPSAASFLRSDDAPSSETLLGEFEHVTRHQERIDVELRRTIIRNEDGRPAMQLFIAIDISKRKETEAREQRRQRLESIGTLTGGIAHDLNNVLTPILMGAKLLSAERPGIDAKGLLTTIQASAERGAEMIQQLLAFAGGAEGEHGSVNLQSILNDLQLMLQHTFPKSIQIELTSPADLWSIHGDRTGLSQVMINLCVNARDAMPLGGTLSIRAENVDDASAEFLAANCRLVHRAVRVTIHDTGTGIAPEILDKVFDPFFTTKPLGAGTGLGLSTSLGIVKSHGGVLSVKSEVGQGTCFTLLLPATIEPVLSASLPSQDVDQPARGELLLVIDDEPNILRTTKEALESYGYRVLTASEGAAAIALLQRHRDDISAAIIDMMMPKMNGEVVMAELRRLRSDLPMIGMSGLRTAPRAEQVLAAGAQLFLPKPFSVEQLVAAVRTVLRGSAEFHVKQGPDALKVLAN